MPRKLLVTTDFSKNSRGAIRFAIQMAKQTKQSLIFFHCLPYLKPTRWTDAQYDNYSKNETEKTAKALERFVLRAFRDAGVKRPKFESIVRQSPDVAKAIVDAAVQTGASALCISPRGASRLRKLAGTHSSAVIHASPIPVFVIPGTYRSRRLKHIIYASDLNRIARELKVVRGIAKELKAKISVLHYDYLADVEVAREKLQKVARKYKYPSVKFRFRKYNIDKSLAYHLLKDIKASGASVAVLFTNQKRGWFDRLFLSSKSIDVAHEAAIPLLIIPKP